MKTTLKTIFLFLVITIDLLAQEDMVVIRGRAVDAKSGAPIEGATCFLASHQYLGAISDADGNFSLSIPKNQALDSIIVSHLSYQPKYTRISSLPLASDKIDFVLEWKINLLDEVIVKGTQEELETILLRAFEKIPINYANKPHLLRGFYRKLSTAGTAYTHLEEAMVVVEDYNYRKPFESVKVKVTNFRETMDRGAIDSLFYKVSLKIVQTAAREKGVSANPLSETVN